VWTRGPALHSRNMSAMKQAPPCRSAVDNQPCSESGGDICAGDAVAAAAPPPAEIFDQLSRLTPSRRTAAAGSGRLLSGSGPPVSRGLVGFFDERAGLSAAHRAAAPRTRSRSLTAEFSSE
jgi:hypothetical protein